MFGLSLLEPIAFVGAVMHVIFHSIVKDTLFLNAGAVIMKSGRKKVKELDGIGRKMPVTMWCFTLVSITLIGIPPTSAFVSKWYLGVGALNSGIPIIRWLGVAVLLVSALLTAGYLLTVSLHAFFADEPTSTTTEAGHKRESGATEASPDHKAESDATATSPDHKMDSTSPHGEITDPGAGMLIPMVILTILAVVLGIMPKGLIDVISGIAATLF
jgi:multicomponent Na+:H+ antiporter subunit D